MHGIDDADRAEAEQRWELHSGELVRYATLLVGPDDAADVVSMAFAKVSRSATAIEQVRPYLFRTVTTVALDQHRSRRRRQVRDLHAVLPPAVAAHETNLDVRRAIASLSVQQRAVVYFTYWEDLDAAAIGDLLDISTDSVRTHLARARDHLRKALR